MGGMMSEIKWNAPLNSKGTDTIKQHAWQSAKRLKPITGEPYYGNRTLCSGDMQMTMEGPKPLTIDEISDQRYNKEIACKKCAKIAGKL